MMTKMQVQQSKGYVCLLNTHHIVFPVCGYILG